MPNRYSGMYDDYMKRLTEAGRVDPYQESMARSKSQSDQNLGNVAKVGLPLAGEAIGGLLGSVVPGGGIPGAAIGGEIGQGAGDVVGQGMTNKSQEDMDAINRKYMERQALMQAIAQMR